MFALIQREKIRKSHDCQSSGRAMTGKHGWNGWHGQTWCWLGSSLCTQPFSWLPCPRVPGRLGFCPNSLSCIRCCFAPTSPNDNTSLGTSRGERRLQWSRPHRWPRPARLCPSHRHRWRWSWRRSRREPPPSLPAAPTSNFDSHCSQTPGGPRRLTWPRHAHHKQHTEWPRRGTEATRPTTPRH